jgi:hypothetical protein
MESRDHHKMTDDLLKFGRFREIVIITSLAEIITHVMLRVFEEIITFPNLVVPLSPHFLLDLDCCESVTSIPKGSLRDMSDRPFCAR